MSPLTPSTVGFQEGAIKAARGRGIALALVTTEPQPGELRYVVNAAAPPIPQPPNKGFWQGNLKGPLDAYDGGLRFESVGTELPVISLRQTSMRYWTGKTTCMCFGEKRVMSTMLPGIAKGVWLTINETVTRSEHVGRRNVAKVGKDSRLYLITTDDFRVSGGYPFSDLGLLNADVILPLNYESVPLRDEFIYDVAFAVTSASLPIIVVFQRQFGGYGAFKIVYQEATGTWSSGH